MTEWPDLDKDITAAVIVEASGDDYEEEEEAGGFEEEEEDHPAIALIDIAIGESVRACKKEGLPEPNLTLWKSFSRGLMNKALWHYAPDGDLPDSPALCLVLAVGGLSVCYVPVIMALYERSQSGENQTKQDKTDQSKGQTETKKIRPLPKPEEPAGDMARVQELGNIDSKLNRMAEYAKTGF
jgi:hypothetical protein